MTDSNRVGFSDRLDLDRFFFEVREQIYVIVKPGDFPNYYQGSDIDVFCYDKNEFAKLILSVGNWYLDQGFDIKVTDKEESHTYVDFCLDEEIEFRFDLYKSLPNYKKIRLKPHYIYSVIENARVLHREFDGAQYTIFVPSPVDDLLLRYVEYIEWYETRPDKIKHLDYILDEVTADSSRIGFLDKLHLYCELPAPRYDESSGKSVSAFGQRLPWIAKILAIPIRRIPGVIFRRLLRIVRGLPKRLGRVLESRQSNQSRR